MLKQLLVENYALIENLELELGSGLNIITGETGAGKSILLGALGLLLGSRSDLSAIKNQAKNCVIEGTFSIEGYGLEDFFDNYDLDYDNTCIIRRVITPAGKSRAFINELPVQVTTLKELGQSLIDIHSQHQTLLLNDERFQLRVLDTTADNKDLLQKYSEQYHTLKLLEGQLTQLKENAQKAKSEQDYLEYQFEELTAAKLEPLEQEALESKLAQMTNSEQITQALVMCANAMESEQTEGILTQLKQIETAFSKLSEVYPPSKEFAQRIRTSLEELKDLHSEVEIELDKVDSDPAMLQKTSERLDFLYSLQQKHRVTSTTELIELRDEYAQRLENIASYDEQTAQTEQKIEQTKAKATSLAEKITASRQKASKKVCSHVNTSLASLGMPTARFEVELVSSERLNAHGADQICFMFASTKEHAAQPIEKVASGGELSRVMLSIKALVAQGMKLPTIIFDEIDTGVSGRIADAMGEIITSLGEIMQVINITHLPQVASKGVNHFLVSKSTQIGTTISRLNQEQRIEEIAKMLSGATITESALEQARFLLK